MRTQEPLSWELPIFILKFDYHALAQRLDVLVNVLEGYNFLSDEIERVK